MLVIGGTARRGRADLAVRALVRRDARLRGRRLRARVRDRRREGLADHPGNGTLHYNLACYAAMAGEREKALEHLRTAFERDPRSREWAQTDEDLASVREELPQ